VRGDVLRIASVTELVDRVIVRLHANPPSVKEASLVAAEVGDRLRETAHAVVVLEVPSGAYLSQNGWYLARTLELLVGFDGSRFELVA